MEQNPNKRKILAEQFGVNPDEYTLSDDGAIATPDNSSKGSSDNGSATQAAFTGARKSIGATGAGLGTAAALSWLAGPEVGLPATAAIILSSLGAGYGGGKLQEKLEPAIRGESEEETKLRLEEEAKLQQAHPIASTVGELAPNLLAFRPSPTALKNVFTGSGAMAKSLGSRILSPAQKAAMMNVGINAGIGTGATLATQAVDGQNIDVMEAVKQGAIQGALFHEPWLVGKALGFHPSADLTIPKKTFTGSGLDLSSGTPNVGYTDPIGPIVPGGDINQNISGNIILGDTAPKASTTLLAEREVNSVNEEARVKQDDFIKARLEQWQQEQSQVSVIPKDTIENPEPTTTFTGSDRKPLTQNQLKITKPSVEKAIELNNTVNRPEVRQGEGNINDFEQVKQNDINEKEPLTEAEQQQDIFDRNYQKKQQPSKEIVEHAEKTIAIPGLDVKVKAGWEEALANYKANPEVGFKLPKFGSKASGTTRAKVPSTTGGDISKQPNVFMGLDSEPITTRPFSLPRPIVNHMLKEGLIDNLKANALLKDDEGLPARGVSIGSTRGTEINPTIATADTAAHESVHHYINELLADPKTAPYAKRLIEAAGGEGTIHPESTVEEVGKRVTDLLNTGKNTKFTDTFLANLKQRLGMANSEDVVKILTDHLINNPSYEERTLGRTINMGGAGKNSQKAEDEVLPKPYYLKEDSTVDTTAIKEKAYNDAQAIQDKISEKVVKGESPTLIEQSEGRKAAFESNVSNRRADILDNLTKELKARDRFKKVNVRTSFPGHPSDTLRGVYYPQGYMDNRTKTGYIIPPDTATSRPNLPEVALHEVVHQVFEKVNKSDIRSIVKEYYASQIPMTHHIDTGLLREVGRSLSDIADSYRHHDINLKVAANELEKHNGVDGQLPQPIINDIAYALDEVIAKLSSDGFSGKDKEAAKNFVTQFLGNEFTDFITTQAKRHEFFPKYENPALSTIDALKQARDGVLQKIEEVKKKYPSPLLDQPNFIKELQPLNAQRDAILKSLNKVRETNLGRYYQKGIFEPTERMVSTDDLVNHITLGLDHSELHGGKSIVDRLTSSLNPFNWTKSETTKIRELNTVEGKTLSNALDKVASDSQLIQGELRDIVNSWRGLNAGERDLLYRTMLAESRNNKSLYETLPSNIQPNYNTYRAAIKLKQENQIAAGELVKDYRYNDKTKEWEPYYREAKINPFYYPNIISSDVFEILAHPGTDVYNKLHDDFIAHQKAHYENLTDKQAEELFREFIEATGGVSKTGSVKFGANRYAEGIGLPDSWIEPDALDASRRYLKRVALDRAFFDNIESKPEVARMAGINLNQIGEPNPTRFKDGDTIIKDLSHNPNVRNVLDIVQGKVTQRNPTIDAATSLASSMLLGPVSAIRDFISVPFNIAKYSDFKSLPSVLVSSLTNFRDGYKHSFETGFNKHDPTLVHDLFNPAVKAANTIYEARNLLYKVSGRQSIYQMANAWAQSLGEAMMDIHITKAITGDKKSISFLQQLTGQEKFTPEDVAKLRSQVPELATKIGQYAMGTNDYRTLPLWAINSPIAPIFRLARWNIEMTNNFNDHVIKPLRNGNPEPFILATLGSLLGGLMVKKLKEVAYDKNSYLPTLTEMANSSEGLGGNKGNIAYYGMALASYAGYAGILSDFARSSMDIVHKNNPQSFNFPAWGLITDSTARIMDATTAIANGESSFIDVAPRLIADEMKANFQLARLANTWLFENTGINKEGKQSRETSEKLRDLRTFNQVEGQPTTSTANSTSNPYEKLDVKRFKHETDISQAPEELHNIVGRLIQQHGNNPEELKRQLRGASANNYQTFPNPKQNPVAFGKYYTFLQNTIGYEKAQQRLQDYLVQNKINTVKSKMVPKIR